MSLPSPPYSWHNSIIDDCVIEVGYRLRKTCLSLRSLFHPVPHLQSRPLDLSTYSPLLGSLLKKVSGLWWGLSLVSVFPVDNIVEGTFLQYTLIMITVGHTWVLVSVTTRLVLKTDPFYFLNVLDLTQRCEKKSFVFI